MSDSEFVDRKHVTNPDFQLDVHATGVVKGTTGKVNWKIRVDQDVDVEKLAGFLEDIVKVLRTGEITPR